MPIVMNNEDTVKEQLQDLSDKFQLAVNAWIDFGNTASIAYDRAYNRQGNILRSIHEQLKKDRDAEAAILTAALSIVTFAIAGPAAGGLASKLAVGMEEKAEAEFKTWVLEKVKGGVEKGADVAVKYLRPEKLAPDAFEPAAEDPLENYLQFKRRVDERKHAVHEITTSLKDSNVSLGVVRQLEQMILNTTFVTGAPGKVEDKPLYRAAALGLWITWAYQRDESYWASRCDDLNWEVMEWEPLRIELKTLGVPENAITLRSQRKTTFTKQMGVFLDGKTGLNMKGFIDWATGVHAAVAMFRDMPQNDYTATAQREMIQKSCNHFVGV